MGCKESKSSTISNQQDQQVKKNGKTSSRFNQGVTEVESDFEID